MKIWFLLIVCMIFFVPFASGEIVKEGSISLLAVATDGSDSQGAVADLNLEIKSGKGRVFLETFPATKITTQISMRFAQQVACQELEMDCSDIDFFYTLKAVQGIVGGASAGAASSVLTAALLKNVKINKSVAITGTINSGGLIGPVGGLKEKIDAASKLAIKKVLIPEGTRTQTINNGSQTVVFDLVNYGNNYGIDVVEVASLNDALKFFGINASSFEGSDLIIDNVYNDLMNNVSVELCDRNKKLSSQLKPSNNYDAFNYSAKADSEFSQGNFYSAASFCFRSNVLLKSQLYFDKNLSKNELIIMTKEVDNSLKVFESSFSNFSIDSVTNLEAMMIVGERIDETKQYISKVSQYIDVSNLKDASISLGFAEERLFSAQIWARFFNGNDLFFIDNEKLNSICESKIAEAEERYNYVVNYLPNVLKNANDLINEAFASRKKNDFVSCIYKASKAKAEADVLMSLFGVDKDRVDEILDLKLNMVKKSIVRSQKKGIFPIISYAYFEYATSLRNFDKGSSLLFSEYALEFSNFDIYLKKPAKASYNAEKKANLLDSSLLVYAELFVLGMLFGFLIWLSFRKVIVCRNNKKLLKTLQTPPKRRLRGKKR